MKTKRTISKKELLKIIDAMPDNAKIAIATELVVIVGVTEVEYDEEKNLIILR